MIGRVTSLLVVVGVLAAAPVQAQYVAVDRVMRLIADNMVHPADVIQSRIMVSDGFSLSASGRDVTVTTRFLREASTDAWAAAVGRDLLPDPVEFSVVLDRAGFDGPRGLRELSERVAGLVVQEARARAAVNAAYQQWVEEVRQNSFNAVSRPGYYFIYRARMDAMQARYQQVRRQYEVFLAGLPRAYAMRPVDPAFLSAVTEVTAVLRGASPIELSSWGPSIRGVLAAWDEAHGQGGRGSVSLTP